MSKSCHGCSLFCTDMHWWLHYHTFMYFVFTNSEHFFQQLFIRYTMESPSILIVRPWLTVLTFLQNTSIPFSVVIPRYSFCLSNLCHFSHMQIPLFPPRDLHVQRQKCYTFVLLTELICSTSLLWLPEMVCLPTWIWVLYLYRMFGGNINKTFILATPRKKNHTVTVPSLKLTARTWNTGVRRWVSFWNPARCFCC